MRNPAWAWDELILACDIVVSNKWHGVTEIDTQLADLSKLLRALPIHSNELKDDRFRNINSVRRKIYDLITNRPGYLGVPTNGGKLDRVVIDAFTARPLEMAAEAQRIRDAAVAGEFSGIAPSMMSNPTDAESALEGSLLVQLHRRRERDSRLRRNKIYHVLSSDGHLACEICGFDFARTYGQRGDGFIECHHVVPLHVSGPTRTRLEDLALICANCHRMIHRRIPWLSPDQLRDVLSATRPNYRGT